MALLKLDEGKSTSDETAANGAIWCHGTHSIENVCLTTNHRSLNWKKCLLAMILEKYKAHFVMSWLLVVNISIVNANDNAETS